MESKKTKIAFTVAMGPQVVVAPLGAQGSKTIELEDYQVKAFEEATENYEFWQRKILELVAQTPEDKIKVVKSI